MSNQTEVPSQEAMRAAHGIWHNVPEPERLAEINAAIIDRETRLPELIQQRKELLRIAEELIQFHLSGVSNCPDCGNHLSKPHEEDCRLGRALAVIAKGGAA